MSAALFPQATFADLRVARAGDPCAQCAGDLEGARVIEVGNIFQLGTKYSEPMRAVFLDEEGKEQPIVMGSYGIGLARIAAAAVEQHHDDNGIVWPAAIAPFDVHLVLVRASDDVQRGLADSLYAELPAAGLEVLYDDRDMSPGIKFKDADLLGCPVQVVVGKGAGEGSWSSRSVTPASGATCPSRTSSRRSASCSRREAAERSRRREAAAALRLSRRAGRAPLRPPEPSCVAGLARPDVRAMYGGIRSYVGECSPVRIHPAVRHEAEDVGLGAPRTHT